MPRAPRPHAPGTIFHIMARGNGGEAIFHDEWGPAEALAIIAEVRRGSPFELFAYCLMPNHLHFLARVGHVPLSTFMQRLLTSWAKAFNIRKRRKGHVFQGRFKSLPCADDAYFLWLIRYIHLNPVRAGIVARPEDWPWSSHREYLDPFSEGITQRTWPISLFGPVPESAVSAYQRFLIDGPDEYPLAAPLQDSNPIKAVPDPVPFPSNPSFDLRGLAAEWTDRTGIPLESFIGPTRTRIVSKARSRFAEAAIKDGHSVATVARFLNKSSTAVSRMLHRANRGSD